MLLIDTKNPMSSNLEVKKCGCKGIRKCAICHPDLIKPVTINSGEIFAKDRYVNPTYVYCLACARIRRLSDENRSKLEAFLGEQRKFECVCSSTSNDDENQFKLDGIYIRREFISEDEESYLVEQIEKQNRWVESQSGRFKQDFGPKANFNKRKLKYNTFTGLPNYSRTFIERLSREIPVLDDFVCIDQCNLKYDSSRAACIDPHFDDKWLWGDRLVTVNLISNTILTLEPGKYLLEEIGPCEVLIPSERRSLLVLNKDARYTWMHAIKKEHIMGMRWAITLREASDEYRTGELGLKIEKVAKTYTGISVATVEDFFKSGGDKSIEAIIPSRSFDMLSYLKEENRLVQILQKLVLDPAEIEYLETDWNRVRIRSKNSGFTVDIVYLADTDLINRLVHISDPKFVGCIRSKSIFFDCLLVCVEVEDEDEKLANSLNFEDATAFLQVRRLISDWMNLSRKETAAKERDEFDFKNPLSVVDDFDRYKALLSHNLNKLNIEMDLKSKMLAVVYNIRRINQELSENDSLNRHIGYCLGDFIPSRFYSDSNSSIAIKSHFRNVDKSFLLNDLAIFYANYLTQLSRDGIDLALFIKQSLDYLLTGFDIIELLGNFELFKLLVLFHLHIKIIEISAIDINSNKISFFQQLYQVMYDFEINSKIL